MDSQTLEKLIVTKIKNIVYWSKSQNKNRNKNLEKKTFRIVNLDEHELKRGKLLVPSEDVC